MKLIHAIQNVDRSKENTHSAEIESFASLFGIDLSWSKEFADRVKQHFIKLWLCTDAWVGLSAFYFDEKPVAIGRQQCRGSRMEIEFLSAEAAHSVRDFILSIVEKDRDEPQIKILDKDEDIGETYQVEYASNILGHTALYKGSEVSIKRGWLPQILEENVPVSAGGGVAFSVHISDLEFPLKVVRRPDAILVEHEDIEELKRWGLGLERSQELCVFCNSKTRYWHKESNNPYCEGCASVHAVADLSRVNVAHPPKKGIGNAN